MILHATIEKLCEHAGIVRVGPKHFKYGDPFEYSAAYAIVEDSFNGRHAMLKGLVADGDLKTAHVKAAINAVSEIEEDGLKVRWERFKDH